MRDSSPAGISRRAVRGLRASIAASIRRFSAIARLRAPTIATVIQKQLAAPRAPARGEDRAGVGVRQREHRVLELDQAHEPAGVDGGRAQCAVGRSSSSRSPCSSAGAMASKSSAQAFGLPGRFTISAAAADAAAAAREHAVRRDGDRHRPHVLVEAGRGPLDHLGGRLGRDVARARSRCRPCVSTRSAAAGQVAQRRGDLGPLVGHHAPRRELEARRRAGVASRTSPLGPRACRRRRRRRRSAPPPSRGLAPPVPALAARLLDQLGGA